MITATNQQIEFMQRLLEISIQELIENDNDIFNLELEFHREISPDARILERKLHETSINHRLAYYLEKNLKETEFDYFKVDIEYNRYYNNLKILNTVEGQISVRPDILIHTRTNEKYPIQHLLVIEAKKMQISIHDVNKIKGFIEDGRYQYLFGFTISYCSDRRYVVGNLYYYDSINIVSIPINCIKPN